MLPIVRMPAFVALGLCCAGAQARFLQTDPRGYQDNLDLYTYVQDDPANLTDPSGKWSCRTCTADQKRKVDAAQRQLRRELPGKIAVLRSLQQKLARGEKLTAAETQAAALMDTYLGAGAGESVGVVGHLLQHAGGILGAVNNSRPANPADAGWPIKDPQAFSEFSPGGDRLILNDPKFFEQSPAQITQTMAHESAWKAGETITGGPVAMSVDRFNIGGEKYSPQGRHNVARIAATRALSPDDMLDEIPDASVSALGY